MVDLRQPGTAVLQTSDELSVSEFERLFFFCAQTISTIGYGVLSPNPDSNLVNFFVFVLVFAGTVVSTLLTGASQTTCAVGSPPSFLEPLING